MAKSIVKMSISMESIAFIQSKTWHLMENYNVIEEKSNKKCVYSTYI